MTMMTRFDPFSNVLSLRDAMHQLLEDSFVASFNGLMQTTKIMPVDVYETDDAFVVQAFTPGFTPDQLNISVEQNVVTIQGEPKTDDLQGMHALQLETRIGRFMRRLALPVSIDADAVLAKMHNGVLKLTLPKVESVKPHKIQIKTS